MRVCYRSALAMNIGTQPIGTNLLKQSLWLSVSGFSRLRSKT